MTAPTPMMLGVHPRELPPECRAWLEPSLPLPPGVEYLRRVFHPSLWVALFLAIPLGIGLVLAAIDLAQGKWRPESGYLLAVFVAPFLINLPIHLTERKQERQLAQGARRMGLFLAPGEVLLQLVPGECSLWPKARVARFDIVSVRRGKMSTEDIRLVFHDLDGTLRSLCFRSDQLTTPGLKPAQLCRRLEQWRQSGPAGVDVTPSEDHRPRIPPAGTLDVRTRTVEGAEVPVNWTWHGPDLTAEVDLSFGKLDFVAGTSRRDPVEEVSYSFEEFLAGKGQATVGSYFEPEVVRDIVRAVSALRAGAKVEAGKSSRRRRH